MNKFKFGDKVQCPDMSVQMFLHSTSTGVAVVVNQWGVKTQFLEEKLELIPHPDTTRLGWLGMHEINDKWPLIEWDDYLSEWKLKFPDGSNAYFKTFCEAVDFAISEENADD